MTLLAKLANLIRPARRNGTVMTLKELAEETRISYPALRRAVTEGRVKAHKSGGTWLSTRDAVEQAIEAGKLRRP